MDKNEVERISALAMFLVDQHEKETQTAGQNDNNPELYDYESCCSDNMILTENWQYTQKRQGSCALSSKAECNNQPGGPNIMNEKQRGKNETKKG